MNDIKSTYIDKMSEIKDIEKEIGKKLKSIRKERGWKQEEVAVKIRSTKLFVSNIERGLVSVRINHLYIFANLYGIDIKELLP